MGGLGEREREREGKMTGMNFKAHPARGDVRLARSMLNIRCLILNSRNVTKHRPRTSNTVDESD